MTPLVALWLWLASPDTAPVAPTALPEPCPDSLLATGCHPRWELDQWYVTASSEDRTP